MAITTKIPDNYQPSDPLRDKPQTEFDYSKEPRITDEDIMSALTATVRNIISESELRQALFEVYQVDQLLKKDGITIEQARSVVNGRLRGLENYLQDFIRDNS